MTGTELAVIEDAPGGLTAERMQQAAANPFWAYLLHLDSPQSRSSMRNRLNRLARMVWPGVVPDLRDPGQFVPWGRVDYGAAVAIRAMLMSRPVSPAHVSADLAALRGVLRQCRLLRQITAETLDDLGEALRDPKAERLPAGRYVEAAEITAAVGARGGEAGIRAIRDPALIAVLAATGLRRAEVASTRVEDYSSTSRNLTVVGKGNKERTVRVDRGAAPILDRWIALLPYKEGPLFPRVYKSGRIGTSPVAPKTVGRILADACGLADTRKIRAHDLRRTFATDYLEVHGDIRSAQRVLGHKRPETTARYDMSGLKKALDQVDGLGRSYAREPRAPADDYMIPLVGMTGCWFLAPREGVRFPPSEPFPARSVRI